MCSIPESFDTYRNAYRGATDSLNDVDVDPRGGRVYAACSSGDVLVWDVATLHLTAQLRLSTWVNAVRCFPLANSAASFSSTSVPAGSSLMSPTLHRPNPTSAAEGGDDRLYGDLRIKSEIRWVLTGSEDGVVAVWSPMTFRTQSICKPSLSAITALQVLPRPTGSTRDGLETAGRSGTLRPEREMSSIAADDAALLCAASLQHIHILRVTTASSELVLLRSLQHSVLITAIVPVCTTAALPVPLLAVGQEDGTLCLWDCMDWLYHDTLSYPTGEADVDEDAKASSVIHEPQFEHGAVLSTFAYNKRRCNPAAEPPEEEEEVVADETPFTPTQEGGWSYQREMDGAVSAEAAALVERRCGPLPAELEYVRQLAGPGGNLDGQEPVPLATTLHYDARRITCLASNRDAATGNQAQLFSGHATGEVLLWSCLRRGVPFVLLKKILLFRPGAWVWRMCAVQPLVTSVRSGGTGGEGKPAAAGTKPKVLRGKAALAAKVMAASSSTTCPSPTANNVSAVYASPLELMVWSDGGSVAYVSCQNKQVTHREGPGFMASAAACWVGEALPDALGGAAGVRPSRGSAADAAGTASLPSGELSSHLHVVMGNFEGRAERYDVSKVMGLVKTFGKAH